MGKKVVLAYSGGLDTSVAVRWMREEMGAEVIALAADVGQGGDFDALRERALKRLKAKRELRGHLLAYVSVNLFLVGVWYLTSSGFFWPAIVMPPTI